MTPGLAGIATVLAELSDAELRLLMATTLNVPQASPGLLAWLEAACDWEVNRRAGIDYELQPPEAAIPPGEDAGSVKSATMLRSTFEGDGSAVSVLALLDSVVELLTGFGRRH